MKRAVEWKLLFSALKIFEIGFIWGSVQYFSEKYVWLTYLDIFSQTGLKSGVWKTVSFNILFFWIFLQPSKLYDKCIGNLKGWVVCRTVYGDMHLKDLLGSIIRVGLFVCLFGFNVALKHLRSYHDGACL